MKRLLINLAFLALGLILIGGIIHWGQYLTTLKLSNKTLLDFLDTPHQYSFSDFSQNFNELNADFKSLQKIWGELLSLWPKLGPDLALKEALNALAGDFSIIQNGEFLAQIIKDDESIEQPLATLLDLEKNLNFLEKYDLVFVKDLQYQIKNWLTFLGNNGPKHYLIIFQKAAIARPSGGFFGAYGILSFDKGKMTLTGGNVFDLDDLLLEKIIPPYPLQTVSNKWFFHDINWFFDFPSTSEKILEFYQKTGLTPMPDGVIAINDSALEAILDITGPIELRDYGLTLNKNNVVAFFGDQLEKSAQLSKGTGREVFSVFIRSLLEKWQAMSLEQFVRLFNLLRESLQNKDLQLYSSDDGIEYFFDSLDWTGKIAENKNDYLAVVFNNLDKDFIQDKRQKKVSLASQISDSSVKNTLRIEASFLSLREKNQETFLKIYLPKGVTVIDASGGYLKDPGNHWPFEKLGYQKDLDLETIESNKIVDQARGLEIFEEGSKTVIGVWTKLSLTPFSLIYQFPWQGEDLKNWEIKLQRQSGQDIRLSYNLIPPAGKKIRSTLFEFKKYFPLVEDTVLSFRME